MMKFTDMKSNTCAADSAAFSACACAPAFDMSVLSVRDTAFAVSLFVMLVVAISIIGAVAISAVRIISLALAVILLAALILCLAVLVCEILIHGAARFMRSPETK